jgi:methylated-DNA-[protein]-cysteine S-methyltransferase
MNHAASLPFPGHALFVTRIGACGLAWNASAICAVQLPEASWGETRERMLLGLTNAMRCSRSAGLRPMAP